MNKEDCKGCPNLTQDDDDNLLCKGEMKAIREVTACNDPRLQVSDTQHDLREDGDKYTNGVFEVLKKHKNSVRYKPTNDYASEIATAIYLMNKTYEGLGQPKKIVVEIRPVV